MSSDSESLGCGLTSDGDIPSLPIYNFAPELRILTSIVHISPLISPPGMEGDDSIFFRFRAFRMVNMMAFMDFGLLLHRLSESRAWLGAHDIGFALPGV